MNFKCASRYCGRQVPARDIEPEMGPDGWSFWCPFCHRESRLVDAGVPGRAPRFVQPEMNEHGRDERGRQIGTRHR